MVRVLVLFLTRFHVNVARCNGNPTWARFKVTPSCCDLPQRQYFKDLFNENGGVFSYDKNPHLPQNYKKNNALLEKFRRSPRKTARRRSTEWFERDLEDMLEAEFVAYFRLILERRNK